MLSTPISSFRRRPLETQNTTYHAEEKQYTHKHYAPCRKSNAAGICAEHSGTTTMRENRKLLRKVFKDIRRDMTGGEVLDLPAEKAFDPDPFLLPDPALFCAAAMQAPRIMVSQNRQEEKAAARRMLTGSTAMTEGLYDRANAILAKESVPEKRLTEEDKAGGSPVRSWPDGSRRKDSRLLPQ